MCGGVPLRTLPIGEVSREGAVFPPQKFVVNVLF